MKGLSASTGQADDVQEAPFISGTFEYGGRAAARRKVYLFANKAQDQRSLTDATVQFLGVFKTDKKVSGSYGATQTGVTFCATLLLGTNACHDGRQEGAATTSYRSALLGNCPTLCAWHVWGLPTICHALRMA